MQFLKTDSKLFFSKNDPQDPRLGDLSQSYILPVKDIETHECDVVLWGYPDDEGIALNGGRIGAKEAPHKIRHFLYRMTPSALSSKKPKIYDLGNIQTQIGLAERHQLGQAVSEKLTDKDIPWLSFGGGHDYGYADGSGFLRALSDEKEKPLIINFDAHLDVRPTDKGLNSGTPFFRLLSDFAQKFIFFEVGLQAQCNSQTHWQWAQKQGALLFPLPEVQGENLPSRMKQELESYKKRKVFISLDIDSLTSNEAPGCSQSWTTGLETKHLMNLLSWIYEKFHVCGLGIYEVSPPLDENDRTSKLAALFSHQFITAMSQRNKAP